MRPITAAAVLFVVALAACEGPRGVTSGTAGCGKDTDCKGPDLRERSMHCASRGCGERPGHGDQPGG